MNNWHNSESFYLLCLYKSFSKVAKKQNLTKAAIYFRIKKFEEEMGELLFESESSQFMLTPVGERVFKSLSIIYKEIERFEEGLLKRSQIKIGVSLEYEMLYLMHILKHLGKNYWDIHFMSGKVGELFSKLEEKEVECFIGYESALPLNTKIELCTEEWMVLKRTGQLIDENSEVLTLLDESTDTIFDKISSYGISKDKIIKLTKESQMDKRQFLKSNMLLIAPKMLFIQEIENKEIEVVEMVAVKRVYLYYSSRLEERVVGEIGEVFDELQEMLETSSW